MFFPAAHAAIDWSRGFESLDSELQKIAGDSEAGPRRADLLFRVWLLSGEEQWVLIHLEIQSQRERDFPERVFEYHDRIRDHYGRPPATFVLLADDEPDRRPTCFAYGLWGCRSEFHYPVVKLLDYKGREAELESSANPFAVVVLAHLAARQTTNDRARRRVWKVRLLKGLYNRGWEQRDVRQLLKLIDWFLQLPREDERIVRAEVEADEREIHMPYVTSFEQMAMEEGEQRGERRGLKSGLALALKVMFGQSAGDLIAEIQQLDDIAALRQLADALESATTIDEIRRLLKK